MDIDLERKALDLVTRAPLNLPVFVDMQCLLLADSGHTAARRSLAGVDNAALSSGCQLPQCAERGGVKRITCTAPADPKHIAALATLGRGRFGCKERHAVP